MQPRCSHGLPRQSSLRASVVNCRADALCGVRVCWCDSAVIVTAVLWSHHLLHAVQPCEHADLLMSDHAPGCGRCAPRPVPRNGLQQLLSPLLRSFLARQTSCLQPSCATLWALRLRVGRPGASDRHQGRDGRGLETANGDYHGPDRYLHPQRRRRVRWHHQNSRLQHQSPPRPSRRVRPTTRPRTCGCWWATSR